jgi:isoleucyl-tRNA synthetase
MLSLNAQVQEEIVASFLRYDFHQVVTRLLSYCSEDLGGFYLDILKDRLYTSAPDSLARRSAQTVLNQITASLLRWMAPILSFTAEEAWQVFHPSKDQDGTIFTEVYQSLSIPSNSNELMAKWQVIREIRQEVTKSIELERSTGKVGSSLQAEIDISAPVELAKTLASLQDDLKFVMITSAANVKEQEDIGKPLSVVVRASQYLKCERCWHYRIEVGQNKEHPTLCGRCDTNLFGQGETRLFA